MKIKYINQGKSRVFPCGFSPEAKNMRNQGERWQGKKLLFLFTRRNAKCHFLLKKINYETNQAKGRCKAEKTAAIV
jgi:hypothetical protein